MKTTLPGAVRGRAPVPRGIARSGPSLLSYGFRPFFLLAATFALVDMVLWVGALSGTITLGGASGPISWHAHEMLFGYGTAALCGFVLTAVPNWTGRLPVSGGPLLALVMIWLAGRVVMGFPWVTGELLAATIDSLFLPGLAAIVAREVIVGHNSRNVRVALGIGALAALNIAFHIADVSGLDTGGILRATVGIYSLLICHIGGRIVPSFTRNWLARQGETRMPASVDRFDHASLGAIFVATVAWALAPWSWVTAVLAALAAASQAFRLARWRTPPALAEPLLAMLHVAFAFVPLGWLMVALSALGMVTMPSALHVLTVGGIGLMTFAVMARATLGHTGRQLRASPLTVAGYGSLLLAALMRPAADLLSDQYHSILILSGAAWIAAFVLFLIEYGRMLVTRPVGKQGRTNP